VKEKSGNIDREIEKRKVVWFTKKIVQLEQDLESIEI